jgi:hypothetical protein
VSDPRCPHPCCAVTLEHADGYPDLLLEARGRALLAGWLPRAQEREDILVRIARLAPRIEQAERTGEYLGGW